MLKAIDARGAAVAVGYDLLGRRVSLESPDSGRVELEYDESGNVARKTDAALRSRGEAIRYEYDGLNRLIKVDYPRSKDTSYEYGGSDAASKAANAAGRLTRRTDQSGTVSYAYGLLGETRGMSRTLTRVTPLAAPESASFGYAWDYLGRMSAIVYPDGEELRYGYDYGGQIKSVTGRHHGLTTNYVADIAYDEFGQRTYIEYGNGARTSYAYDESRRWLDTIRTESGSRVLQDMRYSFDAVGNVLGYDNRAGSYATSQRYAYDGLYQLVRAEGTTTNREYGLIDYESRYSQDFRFDEIGNLIEKASRHTVSPKKEIGDELNYTLGYSYYEGKSRQAERIGDIYYRYDLNGNVTAARKGGHASASPPSGQLYREGETRYTDYGFGLVRRDDPQGGSGSVWARSYEWDEENRLIKSVEGERTVEYRYGDDGQRSSKQSGRSETLYFDSLWQATDNAFGFMQSKHVYVGQHRVATRLNEKGKENAHYEAVNTYYYHSDHLGSAQLVSDYRGLEYERVEYAPYGELWVEKTQGGVHAMPFRFTGKELDEETGLYYYGARYLDPKTSRWLSADPALGEYIPAAPVNDEARKRNENLPGLGGVYNLVNLHVYHYAGNNPIKYVDPDGREIVRFTSTYLMGGDAAWANSPVGYSSDQIDNRMGRIGCYVTTATNAANTLNGTNITPGDTNANKNLFNDEGDDDNKSRMFLGTFAKLHNLRLSEFNGDFGNVLSRLAGDDKAHAVLAKVVFKQDNNSDTHWVGVNSVVTIDGAKYLEIAPSSGNDSNSDARKAGWKFVDGKTYVPISDVRQIRVLTSPVPEGAR